jgi:hypothetical protein
MGSERAHRLDAQLPRSADAVEAEPPEHDLPGKQTEVERALAQLGLTSPLTQQAERPMTPGRRTRVDASSAGRLGFEDYRVLGLRGLLQRLGPGHPVRPDVLAVADRTVARRAAIGERLPAQAQPFKTPRAPCRRSLQGRAGTRTSYSDSGTSSPDTHVSTTMVPAAAETSCPASATGVTTRTA